MELNTILKKIVATFAFILFLGFIIQFVNPKLEKPTTTEKLASQKEVTETSKRSCNASLNETKGERQAPLKINPNKYKSYEKE